MDPATTQVFVSYSRIDASIVSPIVEILRAIEPRVFRDEDSIPKGEKWRLVIEESISSAQWVLVFWCEHSSRSVEVANEWRQAISQAKTVIPIRLDDTPIDNALSTYQGIDFRAVSVGHQRSVKWAQVVALVVVVLVLAWLVRTFFGDAVGGSAGALGLFLVAGMCVGVNDSESPTEQIYSFLETKYWTERGS